MSDEVAHTFRVPDLLQRLDAATKCLLAALEGLPGDAWDLRLLPGLPTIRELVDTAEWEARQDLMELLTGVALDMMGERNRDEPVQMLMDRLVATSTALMRFLEREFSDAPLLQEVYVLHPRPLAFYLTDTIAKVTSYADRIRLLRMAIDASWGRGEAL